jgi:hypothetical protein
VTRGRDLPDVAGTAFRARARRPRGLSRAPASLRRGLKTGVSPAGAECAHLYAWAGEPDNPAVVAPDDGYPPRSDEVRASDAERDHVIGELGDRFVEGRLTHETFTARVDAALRARVRSELRGLVADLPRRRPFGAAFRAAASASWRRAIRAVDRWTRKAPMPLMLPAGPQLRFTIGREPACDLTLEDLTVSRWHASLLHSDGSWLLADLGSTNGTRLNGWRVNMPTPVAPGDFVSFGAATFVIRNRAGQVVPGRGAA